MALDAYYEAKDALDIQSPSKKMMEIGAFYTAGFAGGIESKADSVLDAARSLAHSAMDATAGSMRSNGVTIDYEALGTAVANANVASGLGTATLSVGRRQLAEVMEPSVSQQVTWRSGYTIAGRTAEVGW